MAFNFNFLISCSSEQQEKVSRGPGLGTCKGRMMKLGSLLAVGYVGGIQSLQPSLHAGFWAEMMLSVTLLTGAFIRVYRLHRSAPPEHKGVVFTSSLKSSRMVRVGWVKNQTSSITSAGGSQQEKGPSSHPAAQSSPSALQSAERRELRRSGGIQPNAGRSLPPRPGTAAGEKGRGKEGKHRPPAGRGEGVNPALCPLTAAAAGSMGKAEAAEPAREAGRRRGGSAARGWGGRGGGRAARRGAGRRRARSPPALPAALRHRERKGPGRPARPALRRGAAARRAGPGGGAVGLGMPWGRWGRASRSVRGAGPGAARGCAGKGGGAGRRTGSPVAMESPAGLPGGGETWAAFGASWERWSERSARGRWQVPLL